MGTRFNLVIPGMDDRDGKSYGGKVSEILAEQEGIMTRFQENSELSAINRDAFGKAVGVSQEMSRILGACDLFWRDTLGAFDPALLSVIKKKHETADENNSRQVTAAGWKNVKFRPHARTIQFLTGETGLDLGGFGKGWVMEKIVGYLKGKNIDAAFISFGESTICGLGSHPLGGPWQVNVPAKGGINPLVVDLKDEAISVSGLKLISREEEKLPASHIFSPAREQWIAEDKMVLVQSASPLKAEVLSTACSAADDHQKMHILDAFKEERFYVCEKDEWRNGI